MKLKLIILICLSFAFFKGNSQTFYVVSSGGIYKVKFVAGGTSTYTYVGNCVFGSLAIYKDTCYAVSSGYLSRAVIVNDVFTDCLSNFCPAGSSSFTSLTVNKQGILYAMDGTALYEIDPHKKVAKFLGTAPYASAGDLIFYNDDLFLASDVGIIKINIANPALSTMYISYTLTQMWGLISIPISCNRNKIYALQYNGSGTKLYELDMINKTIVGVVSNINLGVGDGASVVEDGSYDGIKISNLKVQAECSNATKSGNVNIINGGSSSDTLTFKMNSDSNTTGLFNNLYAGVYPIKITSSGGCSFDTTVTVPFIDTLKATVQVTNTACNQNNGIVKLNYTSAISHLFSINNGPLQNSATFNNLASGFYSITSKDSFNCKSQFYASVNNILPNLNVQAVIKPSICTANNGSINILDLNSNPLQFAINNGLPQGNGVFNNLQPGTYKVSLMPSTGCSFDTSFIISNIGALEKPSFITKSITAPTCYNTNNGSLLFAITGTYTPITYSFNSGPFNNINSYIGLASGNYYVKIKDAFGCIFDTSITIPAYQFIKPNINIATTNPTCNLPQTGKIDYSVTGLNAPYTITHNTSDFTNSLLLQNLKKGDYLFYLKDKYGCLIDSSNIHLQQIITGICDTVFVPTAFTPDGLNRVFKPIPYGVPLQLSFSVFNRAGQVMFTSTDWNKGWDGKYNRIRQEPGVYVWYATYQFENREIVTIKGTVLLIR